MTIMTSKVFIIVKKSFYHDVQLPEMTEGDKNCFYHGIMCVVVKKKSQTNFGKKYDNNLNEKFLSKLEGVFYVFRVFYIF